MDLNGQNRFRWCRSCGKTISRRSPICPNCGYKAPSGVGVVIAILVVILVVVAIPYML
ncbi:hypothetical protein [Litchfieldia alkalitelluris]|uniref:hypothetical protein n=1 Tax=Litchfieldia alkalitelluris TaxID=304268 RepID=UPI001472FCDF|nr:hypothetical protein [Litchfieldia alkalitelluris]